MSGIVLLDSYPEYYFSECYPTKDFAKQVLGINNPDEFFCASVETIKINEARSTFYLFYFDNYGNIECVYVCDRGLSNNRFYQGLLEINQNSGRDNKYYFHEGWFRVFNSGDSLSYDSRERLIRVSGQNDTAYDYSMKYDVQDRLITHGHYSLLYDNANGLLREIRETDGYHRFYEYISHSYGDFTWTHRIEKCTRGRHTSEEHTFRRYVKRDDVREVSRMQKLLSSIKASDSCNWQTKD